MPAINPLLYDDQSENEVANMPGAAVITPPKPGAFQGTFNAFGTEAGNIAVTAWNAIKQQAQGQLAGSEDLLKGTGVEEFLQPTKIREVDPMTTGAAAQVIGQVGADAIKMALGPVGWLEAGEQQRQLTKQQLIAQGVDEGTAGNVAIEKGLETTATFGLSKIPFAGRIAAIGSKALRWGAKAGVGIGVVGGMDLAGGETRAQILDAHGYTKQAEQMRHWDGMRVAGDIFGGAMLGLTTQAPQLGGRIISSEEALAARHIRETDDLIHESAPGIPVSPEASDVTTKATLQAADNIANGEPVNVADIPGLHDAHFLAKIEADVKTATATVAQHEDFLATVSKQRDDTIALIEKARRDGHDDIANHYAEEVLPGQQTVVQQYETLLDYAKDDLHRAQNPEGLSRPAESIRGQLEEHRTVQNDMRAKMEDMQTPLKDTSPAAIAQASERPNVDHVAEAKAMIEAAKNPVQQAIEEQAYAGGAKLATKLTPEQSELVNMHHELRQLADATGDHELHAELDEAMKLHQQEHMEAGKFNVAALCAIGM